jgi:hypothetical protein
MCRAGGPGQKEDVMKKLIAVFLLAFGLVGAAADYEKMTKHPDWHFLNLDNAETWMSASIDTEEEKANLRKHIQNLREQELKTGMPPVFIAKHPEPYPHLNPMIKVVLHYVDDLPKNVSPLAIAAVMAQSFSESNKGFKMMDRVQLTRISNFDAGYLRFSIEGKLPSGNNESAMNQVYLIPRGKYIFEITISTPLEYDSATDADLEDMMKSIFILKPFEI